MSQIPNPSQSRKILVVDDDQDSLEIISEALKWDGHEVKKTSEPFKAIGIIENWKPHLVFLDVNMPGISGHELIKSIRKGPAYISVIFISGNTGADAVIAGLDAGADDYIPKPFDPLEMLARVRTQLRIKDLNDQLRVANDKLKELVDIDDLTGLFNMRSIYQKIDSELERAKRFNRNVSIVMLDMDFFKTVNDGHDHLFGSFVLSEIGKIIKDNIRSIDIAARYGGDEFLIMLTETHLKGAMLFCERLRVAISEKLFEQGKDQIRLTASLGLSICAPHEHLIDSRTLVRTADNMLYEAKSCGKNCTKFIVIKSDSPEVKKVI